MGNSFKEIIYDSKFLAFTSIGVSLIISSFLLTTSISKIKSSEKFVSVKGLSERQVKADLALWPIRYTAAADDLTQIYSQINKTQKTIVDFLKSKGFKDEDIHINQPIVTDRLAQSYIDTNALTAKRYFSEGKILVKSNNIDLVQDSIKNIGELVGKGVPLSPGESVEYLFTKLNEIKPEMIEEATKQAKIAANKFAENSGSKIKGIKTAYQGTFSIEPIHYYTPELKIVRVITDIDYFLD